MPGPDPRYYSLPYVGPGDPPPGRWVDRLWVGPVSWRTRHGPAVVLWQLGRPQTVWRALLPGGARGEVRHALDRGWRRPSAGPRRWVQGSVEIRPDDVSFVDGVQTSLQLPPPSPGTEPDLEAELSHDAAFVADLRDLRFAEVAHAALQGLFTKPGRAGWQRLSDKDAAWLVAAAAGMGDSYHDFFGRSTRSGRMPAERARRASEMDGVLASAASLAATPEERACWERLRATGEVYVPPGHPPYARLTSFQRSRFGVSDDADLFDRMEAHLTRLGWRVPTELEWQALR